MIARWLLTSILVAVPTAATAQDRKWEIEGYAGALAAQPASAGTTAIPAPGAPIVTSSPTFPAHATSSWLFGDGAALFNGVLEEFGSSRRIAPLDPLFAAAPAAHPAAFGLRARRWLNPRLSLEVGVDGFAGPTMSSPGMSEAIQTTFDSTQPAFAALFTSGPFQRSDVMTEESLSRAVPYKETAITAAVNRDLVRVAGLQSYVTAGAGVVLPRDEYVQSGAVQVRYTTSILGEVPIDETDTVGVAFTRSKSMVAVLGGGLRHDFSGPWSLRFDARMLIGPDTTRITLDAIPSVARGTPAGFIESFTSPAIQFSNNPSTGRVSTLSGPTLHTDVFKGGVLARTIVSVAIARRF